MGWYRAVSLHEGHRVLLREHIASSQTLPSAEAPTVVETSAAKRNRNGKENLLKLNANHPASVFNLFSAGPQPYLRDDLKTKNPQAPYVLFSNLQHFVLKLGGKALLVSMLLLVADIPM